MSKQDEKYKMASYLANLCATHPLLSDSFWSKFSHEDIMSIQYDLYDRAYNVIESLHKGDMDYESMAKYLFGNETLVATNHRNIGLVIEFIQSRLPPISQSLWHRLKYADNKVLVPPLAKDCLASDNLCMRNMAVRILKSRGVDIEELEAHIRNREDT